MTLNTIVDILKLGLTGLVFLLCAMAYRLLRAEQQKPRRDDRMLRTITRYMWQSMGAAIIVGLFGLANSLQTKQNTLTTTTLETCSNSLSRLDTYSKMPNVSANDFRNVALTHVAACEPVVQNLYKK